MVDEMTEDQIPKFLRIIPNEEEKELSRFDKMLDKYEKKFGEHVGTEPSSWSEDEWCEILEECLRVGRTVDELLGVDECDDWYD